MNAETKTSSSDISTLSSEQYRVTQEGATERPGTGDINSASLRFIHRDDMAAEGYGAYLDQVEDRK